MSILARKRRMEKAGQKAAVPWEREFLELWLESGNSALGDIGSMPEERVAVHSAFAEAFEPFKPLDTNHPSIICRLCAYPS